MKAYVAIFAVVILTTGCVKNQMTGNYKYIVGVWRANTSNWCPADSLVDVECEVEFEEDGYIVFRKEGTEERFQITNLWYDTHGTYKIRYTFGLENGEEVGAHSVGQDRFDFGSIWLYTDPPFCDCINDSTEFHTYARQ